MEKLKIGFGHGGYIVTFGLSLNNIEKIKQTFPEAKPIKRVSVGYEDVTTTLEPYRDSVIKYILPLLTGLTEKQVSKIKEITIYSSMRDITLLTIKSSQQIKTNQSQPQLHVEQI